MAEYTMTITENAIPALQELAQPKKSLSTLWHDAVSILPNALVGEDESGELVIYTGLTLDEDGGIIEYDRTADR